MNNPFAGNHLLAGIDEESLQLMMQLQLQDIKRSTSKGKGRADDMSDLSLAFSLQEGELERTLSFLSDRSMSRNLSRAGPAANDNMIGSVALDNPRARSDSIDVESDIDTPTAEDTSEPSANAPFQPQILEEEVLRESQTSDASSINSKHEDNIEKIHIPEASSANLKDGDSTEDLDDEDWTLVAGSLPESSSWAASRPAPPGTEITACVGCQDEINARDAARVPGPCRHEYCRSCLQRLFRAAMSAESLFPPRCCYEAIPVTSVRSFLTADIVRDFEEKKIEFETPNRTYCCSSTCSAFIPPSKIVDDIAICGNCRTLTHTLCTLKAHTGDCSNDTTLQEVLSLAESREWQRCYSCFNVVELKHGCNHIQ